MTLIGLEINDAGIVCADAEGRLRPTEAEATESPGFALNRGQSLDLGTAARRGARIHPRQTHCGFWDDLSDQPLVSPEFTGYSHAELAYRHLAQVWSRIRPDVSAVVITVPDHYNDRALGLLLGIAASLAIPVRGLVSQALACVAPEPREDVVFHLDIQLHRLVLTAVDSRERPAVYGHESFTDAGLEVIHRQWVKLLADTFVRQTRFDPLYAADTEQALYDRLPALVGRAPADAPLETALQADGRRHRITLDRHELRAPYAPWIARLEQRLARWQKALAVAPDTARLLVTHRAAGLPGFVALLEQTTNLQARRLAAGAAAIGALNYAALFGSIRNDAGVPFLNRVPGAFTTEDRALRSAPPTAGRARPTHLVYRGLAYAIGAEPLVVGRDPSAHPRGLQVRGRLAGISRRHFQVVRRDGRAILTDTSSYGTLVDEKPVTGPTPLEAGQTIRIGAPGETLQVIACIEDDETTTA